MWVWGVNEIRGWVVSVSRAGDRCHRLLSRDGVVVTHSDAGGVEGRGRGAGAGGGGRR